MSRSSLSSPGTHPRRLMPASALYRTAENVSRMSSHRDSRSRPESDTWRARRPKFGFRAEPGVAVVVCEGCGGVDGLDPASDGNTCTLSGRGRRGTGGGDVRLTDLDRPKRGEEGEEEVVVVVVVVKEDAAAGAEKFVYSAVVLRFGWTGGGRSVVGREGDGERGREREPERCRSGEGERRRVREIRLAPATCSNECEEVTDAGGLTRGRGGSTGNVAPGPSIEERELPLLLTPSCFGGLALRAELLRTCRTRACSRCDSMRLAS